MTPLYERVIAFDHGGAEWNELTREVWEPTPWMVDVYVGRESKDDRREYEILSWCFQNFGPESSPIHKHEGTWHRGGATINGWTWFGFSTEEGMNLFLQAWPTPDGIEHPDRRSAA